MYSKEGYASVLVFSFFILDEKDVEKGKRSGRWYSNLNLKQYDEWGVSCSSNDEFILS